MNKNQHLLRLLTQEQNCSDTRSSSRNLSTGAGSASRKCFKPFEFPVLCLKDRFTYKRFDALQNQVAGDVARQILAQLGDQFGIALVLLS